MLHKTVSLVSSFIKSPFDRNVKVGQDLADFLWKFQSEIFFNYFDLFHQLFHLLFVFKFWIRVNIFYFQNRVYLFLLLFFKLFFKLLGKGFFLLRFCHFLSFLLWAVRALRIVLARRDALRFIRTGFTFILPF